MSAIVVDSYCSEHRLLPCNCIEAARAKQCSKYRSEKIKLDGFSFDSKKEAARYQELKRLQNRGLISNLEVHPAFPLLVKDVRVGKYTADFTYKENGEVVVEDVKAIGKKVKGKRQFTTKRGSAFRIKVFEAAYGLKVKIT